MGSFVSTRSNPIDAISKSAETVAAVPSGPFDATCVSDYVAAPP
jgi:hypothetical protein